MGYMSKQGKHGTLYRWQVRYTAGDGSPNFVWRTWAYSHEHAWENWHDTNEEQGFDTVGDFELVRE
jgi:hypothetical protein